MKKLRLLVTACCMRKCVGCCNKDWDLENLPVAQHYDGYEMIMLTGGEPLLLDYMALVRLFEEIQVQTMSPIILYTAKAEPPWDLMPMLSQYLSGVTLTLHEQSDVIAFGRHQSRWEEYFCDKLQSKYMRLNIFEGLRFEGLDLTKWDAKDNIERIKDSPLPKDEVFMKYYCRNK